MAAPSSWQNIQLAPVTMITSRKEERILIDRAVAQIVALATARDPMSQVTKIDADYYEAGHLATLTSPSLFGEPAVIIVRRLGKMNDAFAAEVLRYLDEPEADAVLVLRYEDGQKGKRVVDTLRARGHQYIEIPQIKSDEDKRAFVVRQVREAKRAITDDAAQALVEAIRNDLGELLAATQQLLTDVEGTIDENVIRTYYAGRIEANGFDIADAAVAGNTGVALAKLRHAFVVGVDPVPILAALAYKLRTVALLKAQQSADKRPGDPVINSWAARRVSGDARRWSHEGLARAILAVAAADHEVKGAGKDAQFAVERAIRTVAQARRER